MRGAQKSDLNVAFRKHSGPQIFLLTSLFGFRRLTLPLWPGLGSEITKRHN